MVMNASLPSVVHMHIATGEIPALSVYIKLLQTKSAFVVVESKGPVDRATASRLNIQV
jgi:hypothetical protein